MLIPSRIVLIVCCLSCLAYETGAQSLSHPPLRVSPPPSQRPISPGPARYVDIAAGNDRNTGNDQSPWRSVRHAITQLTPGDTLYLREGVYFENVYVALQGLPDQPITLRAYPGEQAIIDGSLPEFQRSPADAWEEMTGAAPPEFRSKLRHSNLRDVTGSFGDSRIGLQTYYHAIDLRSTNELIDWDDWDRTNETDLKPLYCGPGLWYDPQTGHIHARLAHTHLPAPVPNYQGPSDPRKLPLVIAPLRSVPLTLDGAKHVRIQDLEIRGAGYTAIQIDQASDVEFDNVTVWCATYGMRVAGTQRMKISGCGFYGNVAPWTFRGDGSKRDYPGRPHRNLSRLNTHAVLEIESGRESSVYATPQNDQWEIAHCEFTDAHDGVYLGSINVQFHHNLIDNLQDDGVYLSPMYLRHRLDNRDPQIHIYQNVFTRQLTALAFGGPETQTRDQVFVYRNLFDLRGHVQTGRPSTRRAEASFSYGKLIGDHGSPPWSNLNYYHNTAVMLEPARDAGMGVLGSVRADNPRRVFNNIFLHLGRMPALVVPQQPLNLAADGNLFWSPTLEPKLAATFFSKYRSSSQFSHSQQWYPPGSTTHSLLADPRLSKVTADAETTNDYRPQADSPAISAGVPLPADWPDPLKQQDAGKPDIGALPATTSPWQAGRASATVTSDR